MCCVFFCVSATCACNSAQARQTSSIPTLFKRRSKSSPMPTFFPQSRRSPKAASEALARRGGNHAATRGAGTRHSYCVVRRFDKNITRLALRSMKYASSAFLFFLVSPIFSPLFLYHIFPVRTSLFSSLNIPFVRLRVLRGFKSFLSPVSEGALRFVIL